MTFKTDSAVIYKNPNDNGCLMDSDLGSLSISPTDQLSSSWVSKEYTGATLEGTNFTTKSGRLTFIPVQVCADKSVSIECIGVYRASVTCTTGATGLATHQVKLKDMCPDDSYVEITSVNITCTRDSNGEGYGSYAGVVIPADGIIKSNALKFWTQNGANTNKTASFDVIITVTASISNTDFGLGKLFPNKEASE